MKKVTFLILISIPFLLSGCVFIFGGCGTFGATSTYDDEFIIDQAFEPIQVAESDTLILRPGTHIHINYTYTGSSKCDGEDYQDGPSDVHPTVQNDTLAAADEFYNYDSEPIWSGTEMKVRIIGKAVGQTTLNLEIMWSVETRDYYLDKSKNFEVGLTITDPPK